MVRSETWPCPLAIKVLSTLDVCHVISLTRPPAGLTFIYPDPEAGGLGTRLAKGHISYLGNYATINRYLEIANTKTVQNSIHNSHHLSVQVSDTNVAKS